MRRYHSSLGAAENGRHEAACWRGKKDACLIAQITDCMLFALISPDFPILKGAKLLQTHYVMAPQLVLQLEPITLQSLINHKMTIMFS